MIRNPDNDSFRPRRRDLTGDEIEDPAVAPYTTQPALDRERIIERERRLWRDLVQFATPLQRQAMLDVADELRRADA
jgi:hypothetical protein